MIDLSVNEEVLSSNIALAREKGIILPTLSQMAHPEEVPEKITEGLKNVGLWDIDPLNLFRISWHNEPKEQGGVFGGVNYLVLPEAVTGVKARIVALCGKWFPTGCHKVGASYGCLAPRLVTGQFDAARQKAVWPSTGNYCRGGAFNSTLLGVHAVGIMPEGMSRERFDWLRSIGCEVITTPGGEANVKEIFDKTNELKADPDFMIFNQFEESGNHLWHYAVTGPALEEAVKEVGGKFAGCCFSSGSGGTSGAGDYLKEVFPGSRMAVCEAVQCPTLLKNGYGEHRIEGIGDKHVPWIHNVKNTDLIIDVDDEAALDLLRLFNCQEGRRYLIEERGLEPAFVEQLSLMGISGIANVLACIKFARYYELGENDVVATVLTDSAAMYLSRIDELNARFGPYSRQRAAVDHALYMLSVRTDMMEELRYTDRKRIHNLKYFTWVEQQGRTAAELDSQWYDYDEYWGGIHAQAKDIDALITAFNSAAGLI